MEAEILGDTQMTPISNNEPVTNDNIFQFLMNEEDLTWQTMIYELVKSEQMDPWDIDISRLSKKFVSMVNHLKQFDFRVSGKIILASVILLKMKSNKLLTEDILAFDNLIKTNQEPEEIEELYDEPEFEEPEQDHIKNMMETRPKIFPRTPQPRKRKVSVFDLVKALEKALEVKNRRYYKDPKDMPKIQAPKDHKDISLIIGDTHDYLMELFKEQETDKLFFHKILQSETKEDKIYTFIPLLHLTNQRKIDLEQYKHFGDIEIHKLEE